MCVCVCSKHVTSEDQGVCLPPPVRRGVSRSETLAQEGDVCRVQKHFNRIRVGSLKPEKQRACGTLAGWVRSTDSASPRLLDASPRLSQRCLPGSSCPCQLSRRLLCLLPGGTDGRSPSPPSSWKRKSLADVALRLGANEDLCAPPPPTLPSSVHRSDSRGLKLNRSVSSSLYPPTIDPYIPASPRCRYFSLNSALTSPAAPPVPPPLPPTPPI